MSDDTHVRLDVSDRVAVVQLDRAPVNAINTVLRGQLAAVAAELTDRSDVGAVVVHGAGKHFAAGADIRELVGMTYQTMLAQIDELQASIGAFAAVPKPTIAAITGYALGGGLELALGCDFRIAADNAKLGVPEIQLGTIPGGGGTQRLARLIGPAWAKDLLFSGRHVGAAEALAIGLVDEVVAPGEVLDAALARARTYANGPALALRAAKEAVDRGLDGSLETGLAIERQLFAPLFATDDCAIGMQSFFAAGPGKAAFTGR